MAAAMRPSERLLRDVIAGPYLPCRIARTKPPRPPKRPLSPEQSQIAAKWFPYAMRGHRLSLSIDGARYHIDGYMSDRLYDAAVSALVGTARRYKPDLGLSVGTFLNPRLRGSLVEAVRSETSRRSTRRPPPLKSLNRLMAMEGFEPSVEDDRSGEGFEDLIKSLRPRSRRVITLGFRDGLTDLEISRETGLGLTRITQIRRDSLEHLKRSLSASPR